MKKVMAGSGGCVSGTNNCVYIYGGTLPCCAGHCVVPPGSNYGTCQFFQPGVEADPPLASHGEADHAQDINAPNKGVCNGI